MVSIRGQKFLTIYAESDNVYEIDFESPGIVSILNLTGDDIQISTDKDFPDNETESAGLFLTIPANASVNGALIQFDKVYIKTSEQGNVVIERCG